MKYYTLKACEELIKRYVDSYQGEVFTIEEGVLGLGTIVLVAHGKKNNSDN